MRAILKMTTETQVALALREELLSGSVAPGTRLTEEAMAADLGVARATLRTALNRLSQEGLVTQEPYRGWYAANLSAQDVWELYTLRGSLEALAARLAAQAQDNGPALEINSCLNMLSVACRSNDYAAAAKADFELHKQIVDRARHRRLAEQYRLISQQIRMLIASSNALITDLGTLFAQHEPIVDAINSGNAELAAQLSERHSLEEGRILFAHLQQKEAENPTRAPRAFD